MAKEFTIIKHRRGRVNEVTGTIEELITYFGYTLDVGKSWEHEKGNHKINTKPRTGKSLVNNLNWAKNNAAANGYSPNWYELSN